MNYYCLLAIVTIFLVSMSPLFVNYEIEAASSASKSSKTPISNDTNSKTPISNTPESKTPISNTPISNTPESKTPISNTPESKTPISNTPESKTPISNTESDEPQSNEPKSNAPESNAPEQSIRTNPEFVTDAKKMPESSNGGCLIATATYGSELAPQIQQLRELRDHSLLQTKSGISFMSTFNQFYYSFSPTIADWERENPVFKEFVKITLTPLISSLSILNYVDMDSEVSVLGYGISLIMLNVGMYFVAPAIIIHTIRKRF